VLVSKNITLQEIEDLLSEIIREEKSHSSLRLPASIKFSGGLGIEITLIQLLITWARSSKDNETELHTYIKASDSEEVLKKYCYSLFGICAFSIAPKITDEKHNLIARYEALMPAKAIIDSMDLSDYESIIKRKNQKGGTPDIYLLSISGAEKEYIKPLYSIDYDFKGNRLVRSRVELSLEVNKIIKSLGASSPKHKKYSQSFSDELSLDIGLLLHELYKNTEEHAKRDLKGNKYRRTISGIKFSFSTYSHDQIKQIVKDQWDDKYLDYILLKFCSIIKIFEISVFDSGPGLARRWTSKDYDELTISEEINAVQNCFKKWGTTKTGWGAGEGLFTVLKTLRNLEGFIRVRTGRKIFSKGFMDSEDELELSNQIRDLAPIEGTSISIIIPF
jgi:hypothetical protein